MESLSNRFSLITALDFLFRRASDDRKPKFFCRADDARAHVAAGDAAAAAAEGSPREEARGSLPAAGESDRTHGAPTADIKAPGAARKAPTKAT